MRGESETIAYNLANMISRLFRVNSANNKHQKPTLLNPTDDGYIAKLDSSLSAFSPLLCVVMRTVGGDRGLSTLWGSDRVRESVFVLSNYRPGVEHTIEFNLIKK